MIGTGTMNIDVHGHYTTAPAQLKDWRERQISTFESSGGRVSPDELEISDDEIRTTIEQGQFVLQRERETDVTLFSPTAGGMAHHEGDEQTSKDWTRVVNDLIHRVCGLFPQSFVGVGQLPQSPGVDPARCIPELERIVNELGFVAVNLNPDPTDGYWTGPAITDRVFYPLYEKMVELEVPAMLHVSGSCNPVFVPATAAHYINGDVTAFVNLATSDLFKDFPTLRFVIPHGGGAIPYHWGRYRGIVLQEGRGELAERVLDNVFFDTCVYWQQGLQCLVDSLPEENVLYASEMIGAVRGRNPDNGRYFDDTKFLLDQITDLSDSHRQKIMGDNALRVYPRLKGALKERGYTIRSDDSL
jgi:4-oxalmesaconate hydratase